MVVIRHKPQPLYIFIDGDLSTLPACQEFLLEGVQVNLTKNALTTFFLYVCFFLVLGSFYRSQMVIFKENYHFSRFRRESKIFQGAGSNFFQGGGVGVQLLIPYRNHITCDFPGGSVPPFPQVPFNKKVGKN